MPTDSGFRIQLNGEDYTVNSDPRLTAVIEALKLRPGRIAVEINQVIVPKAQWANTVVQPGDTVEIVNFVGGG